MRKTTQFRNLITGNEILLLPGVPDAYSARLAQNAGFKAVSRGGITGIEILGRPDVDLATLTELADWTAKMVDAVDIPVFADGDTGHGNVTNVVRTVQLFEKAGVGGLFIEDQVAPKRCGHTAGKQVVPVEEMAAKMKAATDARLDDDLVIMARIDSLAIHGLDEAIDRGNICREAGADMIFIEAIETVEQMKQIRREIQGPLMASIINGGQTPILTPRQLQDLGFNVVVYPAACAQIITKAVIDFFNTLYRTQDIAALGCQMTDFAEYFELAGLSAVRKAEEKYTEEGKTIADRYRDKKIKGG